ncbi:MAG: tetratricopeptide repeat protein [Candidatus Aminicenantes bacterium]|nr:tetratricopeptide repeat protein [Candidatus Aminicenantes bacterium]
MRRGAGFVRCVFAVAAILACSTAWAQVGRDNYYSPENILRFAEYLFGEGDYARPAGEYLRYLAIFANPPEQSGAILFRVGICYQRAKDYPRSARYFSQVIERFPRSPQAEEAYYELSRAHFLAGDYDRSLATLKEAFDLVRSPAVRDNIELLTGADILFQKKWAAADSYLRNLTPQVLARPEAAALMAFAREGLGLRPRSPALRGILSAVMPGAGKMYAGRTMDGLMSLLTVGVTAWQAYDGFHKDGARSVKGWIYGTISAFFYVGNIYGSVVAVRLYNESLNDRLLEKVGVAIHVLFR